MNGAKDREKDPTSSLPFSLTGTEALGIRDYVEVFAVYKCVCE